MTHLAYLMILSPIFRHPSETATTTDDKAIARIIPKSLIGSVLAMESIVPNDYPSTTKPKHLDPSVISDDLPHILRTLGFPARRSAAMHERNVAAKPSSITRLFQGQPMRGQGPRSARERDRFFRGRFVFPNPATLDVYSTKTQPGTMAAGRARVQSGLPPRRWRI